MTRDYSQPHPDAIFKDSPTKFRELYNHSEYGITLTKMNSISKVRAYLKSTLECGHQTIAIFIIKPKKP